MARALVLSGFRAFVGSHKSKKRNPENPKTQKIETLQLADPLEQFIPKRAAATLHHPQTLGIL